MMRTLFVVVLVLAGCTVKPAAPPPPTVRVDVWHDTVCPWCRIGLHNLDRAIAQLPEVQVEVVHHPFLLEPDMPADGRDFRQHLGAKFGPERLAAMFERVSAAGAASGVRFDWAAVKVSPETTRSHVLIGWAPAARRAALVEAIHRAHFEEGKNIGDVEVLVSLAAKEGLDASEARTVLSDSSRLQRTRQEALGAQGLGGVPHFVVSTGQTLHGAQPVEALLAALKPAAPR